MGHIHMNDQNQAPQTGLSVHHEARPLQVWGQDFATAQRMAQALASSALFPAQFKDVGSCLIAIEFAQRIGISPFEVAQNIDIIHGRPSWKSGYILQCIAQAYPDYEFVEGQEGDVTTPDGRKTANLTCYIRATTSTGKVREGEKISVAMAIADGWWGRKDSKWPRMTKQMLRYRAASFFDRTFPTGRTLSIRQADEVEDVVEVTDVPAVVEDKPQKGADKLRQAAEQGKDKSKPKPEPKADPAPAEQPQQVAQQMPAQQPAADDNPLDGAGDDEWTD